MKPTRAFLKPLTDDQLHALAVKLANDRLSLLQAMAGGGE